jgi:hypothetical protein
MYDPFQSLTSLAVCLVVGTAVACTVSGRLGYSPALGFWNLIPFIGGLVLIVIWCFRESPNERRLRSLVLSRARGSEGSASPSFSTIVAGAAEPDFDNLFNHQPADPME